MSRRLPHPLLIAAVFLSLAGVGAFILLFGPRFNIYWLILAPVILAVYQLPAVFVFRLWKRRTRRAKRKSAPDGI